MDGHIYGRTSFYLLWAEKLQAGDRCGVIDIDKGWLGGHPCEVIGAKKMRHHKVPSGVAVKVRSRIDGAEFAVDSHDCRPWWNFIAE